MQNIYECVDKLYNDVESGRNFYKHQNLIITGSNAIGKTGLIKDVLKRSLKEHSNYFYYIDPKNRIMIDKDNTTPVKKLSDLMTEEILEHRLKDGIFTVLDEFVQQDSGGTVALDELLENIEKYNSMYQNFFGITVQKISTTDGILSRQTVLVNGQTNLNVISNSEAAKMRILMEVDFAANKGIQAIIIDEFDAYFSEESIIDFMKKLVENYSEVRFIFVIHYLSVIIQLEGMDIALLTDVHGSDIKENLVKFLDVDNIQQIGQIEKIRNTMINIEEKGENLWEKYVSMIVDGKDLNYDEILQIKNTDSSKLKAREKILYEFIIRNIGKNENLSTRKI